MKVKNKYFKIILLVLIVSLTSSFTSSLASNVNSVNLEVVESGGNGNGSYTKYSDGTMIQTIDANLGKLTMRQMQTNKMWRSFTPTIYFPETFIDTPTVITNTSAGEITGIANRNTTNSYAKLTLLSIQDISHLNIKVKLRVEGRWKE